MSREPHHGPKVLAGLPGMPGTVRGVQKLADREHWPSQKRQASGGGREYAESALPKVTQKHLQQQRNVLIRQCVPEVVNESLTTQPAPDHLPAAGKKAAKSAALMPRKAIAAHESPTAIEWHEYHIRDWQRHERDARFGVCRRMRQYQAEGLSPLHAYHRLIAEALKDGPDSIEYRILRLARDSRGRKTTVKGIDELPSYRSVQRWLEAEDIAHIAPAARRPDLHIPGWAGDYLACWQIPQKPSVEAAYQEYLRHAQGSITTENIPSIHQVRYFLSKLPAIYREKGRLGARELKTIKPFVRRTFEHLWPEDVWSADGHTFDAEVQHPDHGRPFRPEIITIVDIGTRDIVGWSAGLAETSLNVVDALRYGVQQHGEFTLFYVDNGPGFANAMLSDEASGLASRVGFTVVHSLPYASQARGVVERLQRSVWVRAAKTLPSYMGADMDREARQQNHKNTRANKEGVTALPLSWPGFIRLCEDAIAAYRQRPHSGLPKFTDADGRRRHYSPAEYRAFKAQAMAAEGYAPHYLSPEIIETLYRPRVTRKVIRAEVSHLGNKYFNKALEVMHGETVQVAYDIHDGGAVWLYREDGEFLCRAEHNGNAAAYFPRSFVEDQKDKRLDGRVQRLTRKVESAELERHGQPALEAIPAAELPGLRVIAARLEVERSEPPQTTAAAPVSPIPKDWHERLALWQALKASAEAGEPVPEALAFFLESFPQTAKYKAHAAALQLAARPAKANGFL